MERFQDAARPRCLADGGQGDDPGPGNRLPERTCNDLAAVNALIRPGPRGAGMTEKYVKIKNGQDAIDVFGTSRWFQFKNTMASMIYQEQANGDGVQGLKGSTLDQPTISARRWAEAIMRG